MQANDLFSINKWDFNNVSVLAELTDHDFNLLTAHKTEKIYKKGEAIYREGAFPSGVFLIASGRVKKFKLGKDGKELIIQILHKGDLMGYHAILSEKRYPLSATALEESTVVFIAREDFLSTLQQSPELTRLLFKTLGEEFAVFANNVALLAKSSVRERLAIRLIILYEKYKAGAKQDELIEINIPRDDLASLIGSARENVIRELMELKEAGIIETRGRKIIVNDMSKLVAIAREV